MKKRLYLILSIIIIICLAYLLNFDGMLPRQYHFKFTTSTDLKDESVNDLTLKDSINDKKITMNYGEATTKSRNVDEYNYYRLTEYIEVATDKKSGKINRFIFSGNGIKTNKGISQNNNRKDIVEAYGNDYYERHEQGLNIIGYVDKKNDISLEFWLLDNQVDFIKLDRTFMK